MSAPQEPGPCLWTGGSEIDLCTQMFGSATVFDPVTCCILQFPHLHGRTTGTSLPGRCNKWAFVCTCETLWVLQVQLCSSCPQHWAQHIFIKVYWVCEHKERSSHMRSLLGSPQPIQEAPLHPVRITATSGSSKSQSDYFKFSQKKKKNQYHSCRTEECLLLHG